MELRRCIAAHFAHNNPPYPERRLCRFAKRDEEQEKGAEQRETQEGRKDLGIEGIRGEITVAVPEGMFPEIEKIYASTEAYESMVLGNTKLTQEAKRILAAKWNIPIKGTSQVELEGELMNEQVVPREKRAEVMKEILADSPGNVLTLIRTLEERKTTYWESFRVQETIRDLPERFPGIDMVAVEKLFDRSHTTDTDGRATSFDIPYGNIRALAEQWYRKQTEKMQTTEPEKLEEHASQAKDLVVTLANAAKQQFKRLNFGLGSRAGEKLTAQEEDATRQEYLQAIDRQKQTLREYLKRQLEEKAKELTEVNGRLEREVQQSVGITDPSTKISYADANGKALEKYGVTFDTLESVFKDNTERLFAMQGKVIEDPEETKARPSVKAISNADAEEFLDDVEENLAHLSRIAASMTGGIDLMTRETKRAQESLETWAKDSGMRLRTVMSREVWDGETYKELLGEDGWNALRRLHDVLDPYADVQSGNATIDDVRRDPEKTVHPSVYPLQDRQRITALLLSLEHNAEDMLLEKRAIEAAVEKIDENDVVPRSARARETLELVSTSFASELSEGANAPLRHTICETLGIRIQLDAKLSALAGTIDILQNPETEQEEKKRQKYLEARQKYLEAQPKNQQSLAWQIASLELELQKLTECASLLKNIRVEEFSQVPDGFPRETKAYYDYETGKIFLKQDLPDEEKREHRTHELGHAVIDIVVRKAKIFPLLTLSTFEELNASKTTEKRPSQLRDELFNLAKYWGLSHQYQLIETYYRSKGLPAELVKQRSEERLLHALMDELINAHASWVRRGRPSPSFDERDPQKAEKEKEHQLFLELDRAHPELASEVSALEKLKKDTDDIKLKMFQLGHDDEVPEEGEPAARTEAQSKSRNPKQDLLDIAASIQAMKLFVQAYPKDSDFIQKAIGISEQGHTRLQEILLGETAEARRLFPDPDTNENFLKQVQKLKDGTAKFVDKIQEFDVARLDISKEQQTVKPGLFDSVRWMSLQDIGKFYKDTIEDIKTIFQRRQDRLLKDVGEFVTGVFPDNMGKYIPIWGDYLGALKQYHKRRYAGAELEAVEKWEKAMENIDNHTLLHMLAGSSNKDQIRGILALLCTKRGEMDWNDHGVWRKLSELSGYAMPFEACDRNDMLRDTWLRKMITAIWNDDKELYDHWRGSNDSNYKKGMSEFTPNVDQLSSKRGGMRSELQRQLKLYEEWKEARNRGEYPKFPDDVKMHRYEEVIDYAIRMGKMTMEDKLYYLVRGIASGLLPIDRVNVLEAKYLNAFPFLDYFYQKNNSLPELRALAEQFTERDAKGNDTFKPGGRTTLWLHLQNTREENVRVRLRKGISGARAENIDHEDVPFFVSQLDHGSLRIMANVISGSRQKASGEGWKNAYAGFSSKFKIFGRLATVEDEHADRITRSDIENLSESLVAYMDMDNILTRNGYNADGETRPKLIESEYHTISPSLNGKNTAYEYRAELNSLMCDLVSALRPAIEADSEWQSKNMTLDQYTNSLQAGGPMTKNNKDMANKVYEATDAFANAFKRAAIGNPGRFKEILQSYADRLFDETGSIGETTEDKVREAVLENRRRERMRETNRAHAVAV